MNTAATATQEIIANEILGNEEQTSNEIATVGGVEVPKGFIRLTLGGQVSFVPLGTKYAILKPYGADQWCAEYQGQTLSRGARSKVIEAVIAGTTQKVLRAGVRHLHEEGEIVVGKAEDGETQEALDTTSKKFASIDIDVNLRFDFLKTAIGMLVDSVYSSVIITGKGGLGKTHTVMEVFKERGLTNINAGKGQKSVVTLEDEGENLSLEAFGDYLFVKGHITPKGLYRTLYENNGKIIIFDDCKVNDEKSADILKSALDTYETRVISWRSEAISDLPPFFEFHGRIIMISNIEQAKLDQAVRTRAVCIDVSMTTDQMIDRMTWIVQHNQDFLPLS